MPHADPVNWQSISKMPLIASMIDGALSDTRDPDPDQGANPAPCAG